MLENKRTKFIVIGLGAIILLIAAILLLKKSTVYTDNAYLKADIVIIRAKVTGYITEIFVNDNQPVKTGQILAKIDDRDYQLKLNSAQANVEAIIAKIKSSNYQLNIQEFEINKATFGRDAAKASLELANKNLKRTQSLAKDRTVPQQDLDKSQEIQNKAANDYSSAESNFQAALLQKEVLLSDNNTFKSVQKNLEANLELAKIDLDNTVIKAATDGVISRRTLQVGQLISPGVALAYLVQKDIWILANFKEVQINSMKNGQKVKVIIDSFPDKEFSATIDSLSPATGSEFSILPSENATGNFTKIVQRVPVKIVFDKDQDLTLLRSGLSCEVTVSF